MNKFDRGSMETKYRARGALKGEEGKQNATFSSNFIQPGAHLLVHLCILPLSSCAAPWLGFTQHTCGVGRPHSLSVNVKNGGTLSERAGEERRNR